MRLLLGALLLVSLPSQAAQIVVDAGRGPITVEVPSSYDPSRPLPLLIGLHGYSNTGGDFENYFGFLPFAESEGFFYASPTGTSNFLGAPFWNATDACCDLFNNGTDDVDYLLTLVDEIRSELAVDPWRIHFSGYSNGAFMSFRMSCDHAGLVASIAGQSGVSYFDPLDCQPSGPVHTLQIHGTSDGTIAYNGGSLGGDQYPGAIQTSDDWAGYNGCDPTPDTSAPNLDLDSTIGGAEAERREFLDACTPGGSTRLWTVPGGAHRIAHSADYTPRVVEFLLGHRKAGLYFADATNLVWPPLFDAAQYQVFRGDIADLFDSDADGLIQGGYGDCETATALPAYTDNAPPAPGDGFFYLIGFRDSDGNDSMLGTVPNGAARWPFSACP